MTGPTTFYEEQAEEALKRLDALRKRGTAAAAAEDASLVGEVLEELGIALHELQASSEELREQNEALLSAEGSIAAERQRYQDLYNFAPDGYLVTDLHGMIREANHMAAEILGVEVTLLATRPLAIFLNADLRSDFRNLVNQIAKDGSNIETLETIIARKDGSSIPAVLRVTAARRVHDGERELRWTLRDVSEQRQARQALRDETALRHRVEASLRRSEVHYRHLVEHASDLVYELDEAGRFTFCNQHALHRLLGYTELNIVGRKLTELVRPDHRKAVRASITRAFRDRGTYGYLEFPIASHDGQEVWLGQHAAVIEIAGGTALLAVARDITAQIMRMADLERSGERWRDLSVHLQTEIEAERTRIAREIHDDLGAALTVIRMEMSLPDDALEAAGDDPAHRLERVVRRIDNAIDSVRRICSDLRPSLLDNMGLCAAIEWLAQDVQERAGIRCEANLEGLAAEPQPDRSTALFRIVQEAVTNAVRHAKASRLDIHQHTQRGDIVIEVKDDGCGIKPEDQSGRSAYGIIGMRERAQALGGSVRLHGGPSGTQVVVRMPASAPPEKGRLKCASS